MSPKSSEQPTFFAKVKEQRHIFAVSCLGRTFSTAFQRIVHSSRNVWLWGEPNDVDIHFLGLLDRVSRFKDEWSATSHKRHHDQQVAEEPGAFIANSTRDPSYYSDALEFAFMRFLSPPEGSDKIRSGFKQVRPYTHREFKTLRDLFPHADFPILIRNPITQWSSMLGARYWEHSFHVDWFLREYEKAATNLIAEIQVNPKTLVIDHEDFLSEQNVDRIMQHLDVRGWDRSLIDDNVGTTERHVERAEADKIKNSEAFRLYNHLKSSSFLVLQ